MYTKETTSTQFATVSSFGKEFRPRQVLRRDQGKRLTWDGTDSRVGSLGREVQKQVSEAGSRVFVHLIPSPPWFICNFCSHELHQALLPLRPWNPFFKSTAGELFDLIDSSSSLAPFCLPIWAPCLTPCSALVLSLSGPFCKFHLNYT